MSRFGYDTVFQELFFNELIYIIINNWDAFQGWFNRDQNDIEIWLKTINEFRIDAHAKDINPDEYYFLRICFSKIEEAIRECIT